jgi:hypothetical protein
VLLIYNAGSFLSTNIPGLTFAPVDLKQVESDAEVTISTFDLIFDLRDASTKLTGSVTYKTEIFGNRRVARMMEFFHQILETMISQTGRRLSICSVSELS